MNINLVSSPTIQNLPSGIKDAAATSAVKTAEKVDSLKSSALDGLDAAASKTEISENAQALSSIQELVHAAPDIREGRVAELKARIASGSYHVSAEDIASRLVDEHLSVATKNQ